VSASQKRTPTADSRSCNKFHCYSITSSARQRSATTLANAGAMIPAPDVL
jgi:hypothetical protein